MEVPRSGNSIGHTFKSNQLPLRLSRFRISSCMLVRTCNPFSSASAPSRPLPFQSQVINLRRAIDVVKLRATIGLAAARRESAKADRRSSIVD